MSRRHTKRALLVGVHLVWVVGLAAAEPAGGGQSNRTDPTERGAALDWSHALQAHALAEDWVAAGSTDQSPSIPSIRVTDAIGVRVTLRWSGLTVATGQALAPGSNETGLLGKSIDLISLVQAATDQALHAAAQRLDNHDHRHSIEDGNPNTEGPGTLSAVGSRLQVSMQIAKPLQRITLRNQDKFQAIYQQFIPGYHGLRLTHRSRRNPHHAAWIWPANALAANMSPRGQLLRLLADLGYGLNDLPSVARKQGSRLERFEVIHVVRSGPDLPVTRLVRGCHEIPLSSISAGYLESLAQQMSDFLIRRLRPDGSMAGIYHPSSDRYDPAVASDQDLAWAAYALGRRVTHLSRLKVKHPQLPNCKKAVGWIAERLTRQLSRPAGIGSHPAIDPAAVSVLLMTLMELANPAPYKEDCHLMARYLSALRNPDGSFRRTQAGRSLLLPRATAALVTLALSSLQEKTRDPQLALQVAESQNRLWIDSDAKDLFEALPWLAVTEFRIHPETKRGAIEGNPSERNRTLNQLVLALRRRHAGGLLRSNQLRVAANTPIGRLPGPSWRAADLILVLSSILEHRDSLQQHDTAQLLLACAVAARSLGWLMFHESSCFYVRSRSDVLGGIRKNIWDNRLGGMTTAKALLAVTQLQAAMARLNQNELLEAESNTSRSD